MSQLTIGRRALGLAAAATLAIGAYAATLPSAAAAAEPGVLTCTLSEAAWNAASGSRLCDEGFEIQIYQRYADGRVSGRINAAGGWDPFSAQAKQIKAVVVLIGANNYG